MNSQKSKVKKHHNFASSSSVPLKSSTLSTKATRPTARILRITSGRYRGRSISTPPSAHPMGSRERLALMNALSPYLQGATILDAFAGSGALGIEALSRGAKSVVFVEKDPKTARLIKKNLANLKITTAKVINRPIQTYDENAVYDIILLDPPYDDFHPEDFTHLSTRLVKKGHLALSHPAVFTPILPGLTLLSTKKYAACHISLFTKA